MSYRILFAVLACALIAGWLAFGGTRARQAAGPNILVITADDLGNHLGSYGDETVPTPHIDAIAASGTRFTRAFVTQSSCSASRASFLTGLYPHQSGQLGLSNDGFSMTRAWPTLPGLLKAQFGYFTALAGKLHVTPQSAFSFDELADEHGEPWTNDIERVAAAAKRLFLQARGRPFYIQFDLRDPHRPFAAQLAGQPVRPVGPEQVEAFTWAGGKAAALALDTANYYNGVARLDAIVGRVMAALESAGRLDNTVVVFWSDNGPPFARAKTTLSDRGVRVPLIFSGPGIVAGAIREELVSMVDIMPTVLAMTGAGFPVTGARYTGRDLAPLLRGEAVPWRQYLFTESNFHTTRHWTPARAVTDGKWMLIENLLATEPRQRWEFYNLKADPDNRHNLATRQVRENVRDRLQQALAQWRLETDDPLLEPVTLERLQQVYANPGIPVEPWYRPLGERAEAGEARETDSK